MGKILFYDSGTKILEAFKTCVGERNIEVELISQFQNLLSVVTPKKFIAIIINLEKKSSKDEISAKELIHVIKRLDPTVPIIVTSEKSSIESEREIRIAGIFFYMVKPFNAAEINSVLDEILIKSKSIL